MKVCKYTCFHEIFDPHAIVPTENSLDFVFWGNPDAQLRNTRLYQCLQLFVILSFWILESY